DSFIELAGSDEMSCVSFSFPRRSSATPSLYRSFFSSCWQPPDRLSAEPETGSPLSDHPDTSSSESNGNENTNGDTHRSALRKVARTVRMFCGSRMADCARAGQRAQSLIGDYERRSA